MNSNYIKLQDSVFIFSLLLFSQTLQPKYEITQNKELIPLEKNTTPQNPALSTTSKVIHEDLAAAVVDEISEVLTINNESLDSVVPLICKGLRTLHNHPMPDVFHYLRELKNASKLGCKISCQSACNVLEDMLYLWNKKVDKKILEKSGLTGISQEELTNFFIDVAIADVDKLKKIKQEPDVFLDNLAKKTLLKFDGKEIEVTPKRLGLEIYLFGELILNKTAWTTTAADEDRAWYDVWALVNHLDNMAKFLVIDEDDLYRDLYASFKNSFIGFLNYSETKDESGKNGYKLSDQFFKQGLIFLKNELKGFSDNLPWLSGELTAWITKRTVANPPVAKPKKTRASTGLLQRQIKS